MTNECPDPAEMTPEQMRTTCEERALAEAAALPPKNLKPGDEVTDEFVLQASRRSFEGLGLVYSVLNRGRFLFNSTAGKWMVFEPPVWRDDISNQAKATGVERVVSRILATIGVIDVQIGFAKARKDENHVSALERRRARLEKLVKALWRERGREEILKFAACNAHANLAVTADVFDKDQWQLAFKNNQVLDLRTLEARPGRPEDYITKCSSTDWLGLDAPRPTFDRFYHEIFEGNTNLMESFQRFVGYGLTGSTRDHVIAILSGPNGRNGKGTLWHVIKLVLGDYMTTIPRETLIDSRRPNNPAAPSPHLMLIKGARIVVGSEFGENSKWDTERMKSFSGQEPMSARNPHDLHVTEWFPTHKLLLLLNDLPHAASTDAALWARLLVWPFRLSFIDNPTAEHERKADPLLRERLQAEGPGIAAWCALGCLRWQEMGLAPPPEVRRAVEDYRRREDMVLDWVDERCYRDKSEITNTAVLHTDFLDWYEKNVGRKNAPGIKKFSRQLAQHFQKDKAGVSIFHGIGIMSR
jgi:putative DNA primase/helicase